MNNLNISIFGSKIFLEILNEIKLFSEFEMKYYDNLALCLEDSKKNGSLTIIYLDKKNENFSFNKNFNNLPLIIITDSPNNKSASSSELEEHLNTPFSIIDLNKKIISLFAKNEYKKNSLIQLRDYVIDKNERKIKKKNLELQLSEKEINFLILFSKNKEPISRNLVLKNVWNYSTESETHTVETHIHRLRKKILEKFGDNNFIKNNKKGYYI